ncbi:MAG: YezD family protein [Planctomycetota bacterium]
MPRNSESSEPKESASDMEDVVLSQIRESLRNLRFGHVQIIVQDGVVVQIDRLERRRISRNERQTL